MQIDKSKVQWDAAPATPTAPAIDVKAVKWDEPKKPGPLTDKPADLRTQSIMEDPMVQRTLNYDATDARGGLVRGAGSIGATILYPWDKARDLYYGDREQKLSNLVTGEKPISRNEERRIAMDEGLRTLGVNTDSTQFKTNKLLVELAGTSGVGGALSKGAQAVGAGPALVNAIKTGGMDVAGKTGVSALATRALGGAITGGATAGLVNPEDAAGGALIGGTFPVAAKVVQSTFGAAGKAARNSLQPNPTRLETAREGIEAGYVLPPATLRPTFGNRVLESWSGKDATKQLVSVKNSEVTEGLVRKALGIADDVPLTQSTMENLRKTAGRAYADVSAISPAAAADLEALKIARNESQAWFKAYNRSAHPTDLAKAKEARALTETLEQALEKHAVDAGKSDLIPALRDARKLIAKTYTVGRALNSAAGSVDAKVLARLSEKGSPLSDGLDTIGRFASAFPTAVVPPTQIGSPGVSKLSAGASTLLGGGGFAALGPAGAAAAAIPFVVPPVARARLFSDSVQKGLLASPSGPSAARGLLTDAGNEILPLMYRSSGLLAGY